MRKMVLFALGSVCFTIFLGNQPAEGSSGYVGADTCKDCHTEIYDRYVKTVHGNKAAPSSAANQNGCESCHGPGGEHVDKGGGRDTGIMAFGKKADASDKNAKCLACHEESRHLAFWDNGRHKSAGVACTDCHAIHQAVRQNGLISLKDSQPDLCFACHKDIRMMANRQSTHPLKEGKMKCTDCHNPHGGFGEKMIKEDSVNSLCYTCHAEKRGPFRFEHQPVAENCATCHNVHGSNFTGMLISRPPQLCQECHASESDGTAFAHVRSPYTAQRSFRGSDPRPQMYGRACLNCHVNIHGSSQEALR